MKNNLMQISSIISEGSKIFIRIQNSIKDAVDFACKRVRWNYRTAIPLHCHWCNRMALMPQLTLADVTLVVELAPSGCYQGQTILTLTQAYIDAHPTCKLTVD